MKVLLLLELVLMGKWMRVFFVHKLGFGTLADLIDCCDLGFWLNSWHTRAMRTLERSESGGALLGCEW